jgi:hypothetical protein
MSFGQELVGQELRSLVAKHVCPSSTFEDYVQITTELEEEKYRLDMDAEKFPDEDVDA